MKALHPTSPTCPAAQAQKAPQAELREPELVGRVVATTCTRRHSAAPRPANGVRVVGLEMAWQRHAPLITRPILAAGKTPHQLPARRPVDGLISLLGCVAQTEWIHD